CAHAAPNAHRDNTIFRAAPPALDQDVERQPSSAPSSSPSCQAQRTFLASYSRWPASSCTGRRPTAPRHELSDHRAGRSPDAKDRGQGSAIQAVACRTSRHKSSSKVPRRNIVQAKRTFDREARSLRSAPGLSSPSASNPCLRSSISSSTRATPPPPGDLGPLYSGGRLEAAGMVITASGAEARRCGPLGAEPSGALQPAPYAPAVATVDIAELALEIGFLAGHYAVADDEGEGQ